MAAGLIGRKLGMTRIFGDDGRSCRSASSRRPEHHHAAPDPGAGRLCRPAAGRPAWQARLTKPAPGQFKHLENDRQSRARPRVPGRLDRGLRGRADAWTSACSRRGELVDVTGVSKGNGFAGTIARHHFKRGPKTHGSDHYRSPARSAPAPPPAASSRARDGRPHGRRAGDRQEAAGRKVDAERNLLLVKGAVPARATRSLLVRKAK